MGVYQRRRYFTLVTRLANGYTSAIGTAQAAWSVVRMRCIFSESLNESTLQLSPGARPAAGADEGRARMRSASRSVFSTLTDSLACILFPSECRVCSHPLVRFSTLPICEPCSTRIPRQTMTMCHLCGEALDMESARFAGQFPAEGLLCYSCRLAPPIFERAVAYSVYQAEIREMIHLLKYERMHSVAKLLGGFLADSILSLEAAAANDLVVIPVPLFQAKQSERGYNQAELLADAAVRELIKLRPKWRLQRASSLLTRRRDTRSQFELSPRGRRRNLQGAFAVDTTKLVPGCEVLLVDDIYTTGATARECAKVLRRAGARKVWVATLARAQTPRVAMWDDARVQAPRGFG